MTKATQYVVIGTSPFSDVSIATGPHRLGRVAEVDARMTERGWNTESVELMSIEDVPVMTSEE